MADVAQDISIPVVDFSLLSLDNETIPCDSDERVQEIASQVSKAFSDIGFVYLKNHGISDDEVRVFSKLRKAWLIKILRSFYDP